MIVYQIVYRDRRATHKKQCSGTTIHKRRCKAKITYRTIPEEAADSAVVYCKHHREDKS